jgi:ferredoxin-type protein NapG
MDAKSTDQPNRRRAECGPVLNRRAVLWLGGSALALVGLGFVVRLLPDKDGILRPPGALPEDGFLAHCIKCSRCISVCPLEALSPVLITESVLAAGTPKLDFRTGYCDLCMNCVEVCPTPALEPVDKESVRLGVAEIYRDECIAWVWRGCTRCYDVCPLRAISIDDLKRPTVDAVLCNGCGLCENVCPSGTFRSYSGTEHKAIVVVPLAASGSNKAARRGLLPVE